ncbi:MAG: hypothetical protein QXF35_01965 [Candidatus Bilamarchaeaceae archaeon]
MLLEYINNDFFLIVGGIFIISFLFLEVPRRLKLLDEETEKAIYGQKMKAVDISFFIVGLVSFIYYTIHSNDIISAIRMPTFSLAFAVLLIATPLLIFLKFIATCAKRIDEKSFSRFLTLLVFDFTYTIFLMGFSFIVLSILIYFFVDYMY